MSGTQKAGSGNGLADALNPQAVSVLNSDGRRTFLFRLTISEAKEARVLRLLATAGDFADLGNETLPLPEQILSTTDFMYEAAPESVPL